MCGCASPVIVAPPSSNNAPTTTPTVSPTFKPAPLNMTLDYFGIKSPHPPTVSLTQNTIQLFGVISDGKTTKQFEYPSNGIGIPAEYFHLESLDAQRIFSTTTAGDYLSVSILAYSCEDKESIQSLGRALQAFEPSMGPVLDFYDKLPQSKELIGWYVHTWESTENWGINQKTYEAGNGDLKLWFRIYSDSEPQVTPKPAFLPNVKITSVTPPINAKPGYSYPITFTVVNNEDFDIAINWEADSSLTGKFGNGTVNIAKNSTLPITNTYGWQAGNRTITYTIYYWYNNKKLDTLSVPLNIEP